MSEFLSPPTTENQQLVCEFESECAYAKGCACKGAEKNQCAALPGDSNLFEICREVKPSCTAKMFFGYTTIICMCPKRQRKNKGD